MLVSGLKTGRIPSLNNSRYFLFEPPHHVPPPRIEDNVFNIMSAGYMPILTHPERLSWIESHYSVMEKLVQMGMPMQITAGSVTGQFGRRVRYALADLDASADGTLTAFLPPTVDAAVNIAHERFPDMDSFRAIRATLDSEIERARSTEPIEKPFTEV